MAPVELRCFLFTFVLITLSSSSLFPASSAQSSFNRGTEVLFVAQFSLFLPPRCFLLYFCPYHCHYHHCFHCFHIIVTLVTKCEGFTSGDPFETKGWPRAGAAQGRLSSSTLSTSSTTWSSLIIMVLFKIVVIIIPIIIIPPHPHYDSTLPNISSSSGRSPPTAQTWPGRLLCGEPCRYFAENGSVSCSSGITPGTGQ